MAVIRSILLTCIAGAVALCNLAHATPPELPDGSQAAIKKMATFKVPDGMKIELFAAEPLLASPVAIGLDERNRVFVAEEYRFNLGTEENRTRPFLLDDDLQSQTLDDRLKMYEKFAANFTGGMDWFKKVADQVRLVEDTDGDGKADRSTIFGPDFNGVLDGLAAGVMAMDGDIYFTCIPNLWRLRDTNNDGIADERVAIHTGFGVNAGFLGHDLHGLCWGPDGKLYFSVGDRGFHVTTKEGRILHGPRNGAVFRCFPDGGELEVVCRGLRNPQEIAFDQFGNLFAADNNCDQGDHSRLVYCLEGSDSGWNMAFQSIPAPYLTGPWHAEQMWHLWQGAVTGDSASSPVSSETSASRPAWVLPPVGKLGAGPSGFTYYPGTGLSERYDHHFFLCNYTGNGGIESFSLKSRGAGYEIIDESDFLKPISATDCEFGYDGKLYISDFVNLLWNGGSAGGRLYTLYDPNRIADPAVKETSDLVKSGFRNLPTERLAQLLASSDMRIRQRAQFELAARGVTSVAPLQQTLATSTNRLARLHALWGIGQLAAARGQQTENSRSLRASAAEVLISFTNDNDTEVRAWAARLSGECKHPDAAITLVKLLSDPSPRVRLFAALALAHVDISQQIPDLQALLRENNNSDPWIRHACVMALVKWASIDPPSRLGSIARDKSPAVRLAGLLAVRHLFKAYEWSFTTPPDDKVTAYYESQLQEFLRDEDIQIVTEAARAINDLHLNTSLPSLAAMTPLLKGTFAKTMPESLSRRVINANFRLGDLEHAQRVFSLVIEPGLSMSVRKEALAALLDWPSPGSRDRVTGFWRPVGPRDAAALNRVKGFLGENIPILLAIADNELQTDVVKLIERFQIPTDDAIFEAWITDQAKSPAAQSSALRLLTTRKSPRALIAITTALRSDRPQVRAEALAMFAILDPPGAVGMIVKLVDDESASLTERQRALATLAHLKLDAADISLKTWSDRLKADKVPDSLVLDVLEAADVRALPELQQAASEYRGSLALKDLLTRNRMTLNGGDAERGREIFQGHRVGQCVRCHKVGQEINGGNAGPDLRGVAGRHDRESLLMSILEPNAKIAKGFETITVVLTNGQTFGGLIRKEEDGRVTLEKPDGAIVTISVDDIEERSVAKSAMPEMTRVLSQRELRDLVAFLAQLR